MRLAILFFPGILAAQAGAQVGSQAGAQAGAAPPLTRADSALVGRILQAEDRRDSTDAALAAGVGHPDERVRTLAQRALGRIRDSLFEERTRLPALRPPPTWVEPDWRVRYRALTALRDDCGAMRLSLMDSAWAVRLRVMDLLRTSCAPDELIVTRLHQWVDSLPARAEKRRPGGVSWHAAAHAIVALARLRPDEARRRFYAIERHRQWQVRQYVVRAAAVVSDTALLRRRVADPHANVAETAITALARLTGRADDALFLAALDRDEVPVLRATAVALKGSTHPGVRERAARAFARVAARDDDSAHDTRVALLELAGMTVADDRRPGRYQELPADAVALALGREVRLKVTLARASGGGSFVVRLRGDVAPMMAARVLELVRRRYYDDLTWHRVEHDFVIQGLGPAANEYVGHPRFFRDELGTVSHLRGTVGMSTRGHDTGDAQWFVNLKDNVRLDRDYTVFAEVVEGIAVVDGILEGDRVAKVRRLK